MRRSIPDSAAKARWRADFFLLLLLQPLALLLQPRRIVALERIPPPALEFQHPAGDVVQEVTVMGHHHHGAGVIVQRVFQPGDAFGVQMVGRLVQQQQVGLFQQQLAQRDPALLAARQFRHRRIRRRAAQRVQRDVHLAVELPAVLGSRSSPANRPVRRAASFISSSLMGSANFAEISLNRFSAAFRSANASSTFSPTVLVGSSGGSCAR